jgi:hypothetical protein
VEEESDVDDRGDFLRGHDGRRDAVRVITVDDNGITERVVPEEVDLHEGVLRGGDDGSVQVVMLVCVNEVRVDNLEALKRLSADVSKVSHVVEDVEVDESAGHWLFLFVGDASL